MSPRKSKAQKIYIYSTGMGRLTEESVPRTHTHSARNLRSCGTPVLVVLPQLLVPMGVGIVVTGR